MSRCSSGNRIRRYYTDLPNRVTRVICSMLQVSIHSRFVTQKRNIDRGTGRSADSALNPFMFGGGLELEGGRGIRRVVADSR